MPLSEQALSFDLSLERVPRCLVADELAELSLRREAEHEDLLADFIDEDLAEDEFLAMGPTIIAIALDAGYTPLRFALRDDDLFLSFVRELRTVVPNIPGVVIPPAHMERLLGKNNLRGIFMVFRRAARPTVQGLLADAHRVLVIDELPSAMLQGNLVRSAAALGFDAIVFGASCSDPYGTRVVRGSMGNLFAIPWTIARNEGAELADELRAAGFTVVRLALSSESGVHSLEDLGSLGADRAALVVDSSSFAHPADEPAPTARNEADYLVHVPSKSGRGIGGCAAAALAMWKLGTAGQEGGPYGRA